jgi:transcriptional regulator with XRE-family HTH domain
MLTDITKRLAAKSGKSLRQIADEMQVTEKTLKRMIAGDTGSPSMHTFTSFLRVCGAEIDDVVDIFAEAQFFLVRKPAAEIDQQNTELHNELTRARAEIDELLARVADLTAERETLREKNDKLRDELLDLYRTGRQG